MAEEGRVDTFSVPQPKRDDLELLSVVIPARDEEGCIASTVEHLHLELRCHSVHADRCGGRRE